MPKEIVIVAPDFPPCNLAGVHRSRMFANHLEKFGYHPIVLSVDPIYYESLVDEELLKTVAAHVEVQRTKAFPTKPVRLVGDVGLRSFWHQYQQLCRLARERRISLLYIPIPPNYSALLGPLMKTKFGIPYVIDYIDPWIYQLTAKEKASPKARLSNFLAHVLEPMAVGKVDGITGVAAGYFTGVLGRNRALADVPTLALPYGMELLDRDLVEESDRPSRTLDRLGLRGKKVLTYAGALLPHAVATYRALFAAAGRLKSESPDLFERLQFLFIGTGRSNIKNWAAEYGVGGAVAEVPERQPYLEVLATLRRSHGVLILGSNEAHYTASKTFQALASRRPVLAMLHDESTAAKMMEEASGVELVRFTGSALGKVDAILRALKAILSRDTQSTFDREPILREFSAENMSSKLARFFDEVLSKAGAA